MTTRAQATARVRAAITAAGVHALPETTQAVLSQTRLPTGAVVTVRSSLDADGRVVTRVRAPSTRPGSAGRRSVVVPRAARDALEGLDDVEVTTEPASGDPLVRWPA